MKKLLFGIMAALSFTACEGSDDSTCCVTAASFTSAQCNTFALSYGCKSGEAQTQMCGTVSVQGCVFHSCPTDGEAQCKLK